MKNLLFAAALAALGFAGCASHQFAQPSGTWTTRTGQLLYREGGRSIVGELSLSRSGQSAQLEFTKGPGLSLLRVQRDATHARFDGPLARLSHTVALNPPPQGRDAAWLAVMERGMRESQFTVTGGEAKLSVQLAGGH
jgi:hypothetical protein